MNSFLKLCIVGVVFGLVASASASEPTRPAETPVNLRFANVTVPAALKHLLGGVLGAPYEIDADVLKAHENDLISLRFEKPLPRDELYERVAAVLHDQYGIAITYTDNVYHARLAE